MLSASGPEQPVPVKSCSPALSTLSFYPESQSVTAHGKLDFSPSWPPMWSTPKPEDSTPAAGGAPCPWVFLHSPLPLPRFTTLISNTMDCFAFFWTWCAWNPFLCSRLCLAFSFCITACNSSCCWEGALPYKLCWLERWATASESLWLSVCVLPDTHLCVSFTARKCVHCRHGWLKESMIGRLIEWWMDNWMIKWMIDRMGKWMIERMNGRLNHWMNEWMPEWMNVDLGLESQVSVFWVSPLVPKSYLTLGRSGLSPGRHRAHLCSGSQQARAICSERSLFWFWKWFPLWDFQLWGRVSLRTWRAVSMEIGRKWFPECWPPQEELLWAILLNFHSSYYHHAFWVRSLILGTNRAVDSRVTQL